MYHVGFHGHIIMRTWVSSHFTSSLRLAHCFDSFTTASIRQLQHKPPYKSSVTCQPTNQSSLISQLNIAISCLHSQHEICKFCLITRCCQPANVFDFLFRFVQLLLSNEKHCFVRVVNTITSD